MKKNDGDGRLIMRSLYYKSICESMHCLLHHGLYACLEVNCGRNTLEGQISKAKQFFAEAFYLYNGLRL
jgi:hypothetical protein